MNDVDLQSVYIVAQDMDTLHAFYESALGLVLRFRDSNNWTQFKLARGDFSLSSIDEAAEGAVGAVPVFKVDKFEEVTQKIRSLGGQFLSERNMGSTVSFVRAKTQKGMCSKYLARLFNSEIIGIVKGKQMKFGIFDQNDRNGSPIATQYEQRLVLAELYDRLGFYCYPRF